MDSRQCCIGIIGTGGMGARHALNLHNKVVGAAVTGVCDFDSARAKAVAADCGSAQIFADPYELIADERIQAVLIASPDETHADFVMACLRHGKPVLCEKPLANHASDARQIVEAEVSAGRKSISVGFMRRFDPQHVALKQAAQSGAIGRPLLFKGVHRNASIPPDFPAEAVISQAAIHDIDSTRWLLGQEIREVFVQGIRVNGTLDDEVRDLVLLQFALTGGCLATIEVYLSATYGYEVSAEVVGQQGSALTRQPDQVLVNAERARSMSVPGDWLGRFQDAYVAEAENWVRSLQGEPYDGADAWDGYASLVVSDACLVSLASGQPERVLILEKPALYA